MVGDEPANRGDLTPSRTRATQPPSVDAGTLLGTGREVIIVHGNERYRLRLTQNGKLILTK